MPTFLQPLLRHLAPVALLALSAAILYDTYARPALKAFEPVLHQAAVLSEYRRQATYLFELHTGSTQAQAQELETNSRLRANAQERGRLATTHSWLVMAIRLVCRDDEANARRTKAECKSLSDAYTKFGTAELRLIKALAAPPSTPVSASVGLVKKR